MSGEVRGWAVSVERMGDEMERERGEMVGDGGGGDGRCMMAAER